MAKKCYNIWRFMARRPLWGSDSIVSQVLMKHETESKTHSMGYSAAYPTGRERIFFSRSWKSKSNSGGFCLNFWLVGVVLLVAKVAERI